MPEISVVMPCFNVADFVEEAVDSVLNQSFHDFEVIIVDDASTDKETVEKIKELEKKDARISTIFLKENSGVSAARNIGIKKAKGEYILPFDCDDIIAPTYLEKALKKIEESPDIGGVYCLAELFGKKSGSWDLRPYSAEDILFGNMVFVSALFRKSDWHKYGGFDETMRKGYEDWDFWLYFVGDGKSFVRLDEVLFYYRVRVNSMISLAIKHQGEIEERIKKKHPDLYTFGNYYLSKRYLRQFKKKIRKFLFMVDLRKDRKIIRIFGVYLLNDFKKEEVRQQAVYKNKI